MHLAYRVRREFETASGILRVGQSLDPEEVLSWPNHKTLESAGYIVVAADEGDPSNEVEAPAPPTKGKRK